MLRAAAVAVFLYIAWYQSLDFSAILMLAFIWAIAAVGLALVLGSAGQMVLCQASFMLIGAYAYGWLTLDHGVPTVLAALAAALGGGLAGLALSPVLRLRGYAFALGTIAVSLLVTELFTTGSWVPGGNFGLSAMPSINLGFTTLETNQGYEYLSIAILIAVIFTLYRVFGSGARRRAIQFIRDDEDLLGAVGGNAIRMKRTLFVIAAVLAGLAGGIYAAGFGFISPTQIGLSDSFALALVVVIGGNGRLLGAVLGAVIYQASYVVLGESNVELRFALLGAVVILCVLFFPNGLLPAREEFTGWFPRLKRPLPKGSAEVPDREALAPHGLDLSAVTKRFGALVAVNDLTARVAPGSLVALVGPNGAGKSTLLDAIAGELATEGTIRIGEDTVTYMEPWRRARLGVARTFQRVRLIDGLTALENVAAGADQWALSIGRRVSEPDRIAVARAALTEVGLGGREAERVDTLSFGNRRLVEIARVIASRPRLVLFDEPSSGLNDAETGEFSRLVRELHAGGCTVLLVEHNLPLVRELAHEVIAMDRGGLLAHGPTAEVFDLPAFQEAYVGNRKAVA
jgi:branched-chain amino acid transport system permease protein